jgi:hypothetical protein
MTDSERQQILKMIADGKITAAEGLKLMQALEESPEGEDEPALLESDAEAGAISVTEPAGEADGEKEKREAFFARKVDRFRRLWIFPLTFGILVTIGAAYWMYAALERAGSLGFWFFCASLPLALGVLVTALAFSSRESRWLYLNVKQKPGETPQRIVISFPMNLVTWLFNVFGNFMPGRERERTGMVMDAFAQSISSDEPVLIEVHDDDGEDVQVYIG